jgi:hypothetical protein
LRIEPRSLPQGDETPSFVLLQFPDRQVAAEDPFRFGEWLVRRELITREDLFNGLSLARHRGYRLGDALVNLGLLWRSTVEREALSFATFATWIRHGQPLLAPKAG